MYSSHVTHWRRYYFQVPGVQRSDGTVVQGQLRDVAKQRFGGQVMYSMSKGASVCLHEHLCCILKFFRFLLGGVDTGLAFHYYYDRHMRKTPGQQMVLRLFTNSIRGAVRVFQILQVPPDVPRTMSAFRDAMRTRRSLHESARHLADAYLVANEAPVTPTGGRNTGALDADSSAKLASYVELRETYDRIPTLRTFVRIPIVNEIRLSRSVALPHFVTSVDDDSRLSCIVCSRKCSMACQTCRLPMHNKEVYSSGLTCEMYYHTVTDIIQSTPARAAATARDERNRAVSARRALGGPFHAPAPGDSDNGDTDEDAAQPATTPLGAVAAHTAPAPAAVAAPAPAAPAAPATVAAHPAPAAAGPALATGVGTPAPRRKRVLEK
jgi:hypothetical protein